MTGLKKLTAIALALSIIVISLGAYTRLVDAGLGCPDWPGCYGHALVPSSAESIAQAEAAFPNAPPVVSAKAWPEMIHRYLAASFGIIAIVVAIQHIQKRKQIFSAAALITTIVLQALLGLLTVTLQLHPLVVMLHLLGGFVSSMLCLWLLLGERKTTTIIDKWGYLILGIIFMQAFFGAWTSANYSSLICPDFPSCQGKMFPPMAFKQAFNFFMPVGQNYQYGILNNISRVTIHMTHRYFAVITSFGIIGFLLYTYYNQLAPTKNIITVASILCIQISLGVLNVILLVPTYIAVGHNICGLLLLLSWTWLIHSLSPNTQTL